MPVKEIWELLKRELDNLREYITATNRRLDELDKEFIDCRKHCDHARDTCKVKEDHENRLRELEKHQKSQDTQIAVNSAATWKGAKFIGACTLTAALTTGLIALVRYLVK